jgi:hypothetical protein
MLANISNALTSNVPFQPTRPTKTNAQVDSFASSRSMNAPRRPKALIASKTALAQRMHVSGESAGTIATKLCVSRATVYRVLAGADRPNILT